ncbi:MAG: CbiX/SirB N-terminal domain-containing protein, partial [Gammaproteobacteria bacterium]
MKSLLLVAHGSRLAKSNDEVRQLTECLAGMAGEKFDRVSCAFLELAEPSIPDGLRADIGAGAGTVVVLPYFLAAGRHVVTDIPAEVEIVRQEHPAVDITVAPYLGAARGLLELLLVQAQHCPQTANTGSESAS